MKNIILIQTFFFLVVVCQIVFSFECYVCEYQDDNNEKCRKTIKTCKPEEDRCMTEIKWGTTPYWQAGAQKQFYITKKCATEKVCNKTINGYMPYCTHIWYEDWKCADCCKGDRCNYFVISGAENISGKATLLLAIIIYTFLHY